MATYIIGLILSIAVIAAAVLYAAGDGGRYPDLEYIRNYIATIGAVLGLTVVWLGVLVAKVVTKTRNARRTAP